jgi:hypothetical protein
MRDGTDVGVRVDSTVAVGDSVGGVVRVATGSGVKVHVGTIVVGARVIVAVGSDEFVAVHPVITIVLNNRRATTEDKGNLYFEFIIVL